MADVEFADGLFFSEPRNGAPDFILGNISVKPGQFIAWLEKQKENDRGYVNMDVKRSKAGNIFVALNTWKPKERDDWKTLEEPPF